MRPASGVYSWISIWYGNAAGRGRHDDGLRLRARPARVRGGEADLITMVAVLHHLDIDDTLARIPGLLAPGGRLLVVGLARVNALPDLAADLISAAANPVMGLIRHPRPARPTRPMRCTYASGAAGTL